MPLFGCATMVEHLSLGECAIERMIDHQAYEANWAESE